MLRDKVEGTPGDWWAQEIKHPDGTYEYRVNSTDEHGNIWTVAKMSGVGEKGRDAEANAHLIAWSVNQSSSWLQKSES